MTEKWIIKNGEIIDTENNISLDSFVDVVIVLNQQSKNIKQLFNENELLKQRNRHLELSCQYQAKFIAEKGYDIREVAEFARNGGND